MSDDAGRADFADDAGAPETVLVDGSAEAPQPEVIPGDGLTDAALWAELWCAIDACVLAESHLRHWLKEDHPSLTAPLAEGVKHYGNLSAAFDLWAGCRGIGRLRIAADAWRHATAPVTATRPEMKLDAPRRLL